MTIIQKLIINFKTNKTMTTFSKNLNNFPSLLNEIFAENNFAFAPQNYTPAANITETSDAFHIDLAVPGYKKEQFKIEVLEKALKVSVEKIEDAENAPKTIRKEFSHGSFTRTFRLSNLIDTDNIEASYNEGILSLQVPKKEEAKPKEPRVLEIA